jgi:hypothetical protein
MKGFGRIYAKFNGSSAMKLIPSAETALSTAALVRGIGLMQSSAMRRRRLSGW